MKDLFTSSLGRLRIAGFLEGASLLLLLFVAVPFKYLAGHPQPVQVLGPVHGALFTWFVINTLYVAVEQGWRFKTTTWKVLLACMLPFGTFYIDWYLLRHTRAKKE